MILDFWLCLIPAGVCVQGVDSFPRVASDRVMYDDVGVQRGITRHWGLSHTCRRGSVCNDGPRRQQQVGVLMTDISPGKVLSTCYRNLPWKSSTSRNNVLLFSIKDFSIYLIFVHLVDEMKSEEADKFSIEELNFSFPRWFTSRKTRWFKM